MEEIINKLKDLNDKTKGFYSIKLLVSGGIVLKNYENTVFITEDVQELREEMYKLILKNNETH